MISLQVNGKRVELERPTPLLAYLDQLGVNPRAVEVSQEGGRALQLNSPRSQPVPDRRLGLGPLVPRLRPGCHSHRSLVALASQQHAIARARELDCTTDRRAPVDDDLVVVPGCLALGSALHVARNLHRILVERIVGGDDEEVRKLGCRPAHARTIVVGARG